LFSEAVKRMFLKKAKGHTLEKYYVYVEPKVAPVGNAYTVYMTHKAVAREVAQALWDSGRNGFVVARVAQDGETVAHFGTALNSEEVE
jgi:hypothetical protein